MLALQPASAAKPAPCSRDLVYLVAPAVRLSPLPLEPGWLRERAWAFGVLSLAALGVFWFAAPPACAPVGRFCAFCCCAAGDCFATFDVLFFDFDELFCCERSVDCVFGPVERDRFRSERLGCTPVVERDPGGT